ncbi:MAG TPA: MotA/TolQ/ExbB proton channel family protein [Kofleriaceae bacterium]|nr:MotA/TolQ/ExbB proton channel family protein [Kofleriaceae bacterium]
MNGIDFYEMITNMSIPVWVINGVIGVFLIATVYLFFERFITYNAASSSSFNFVVALRDTLGRGRVDEAQQAARRFAKSPVARVVEAGLIAYRQGRDALTMQGPEDVGEFDVVDSVNRALERVKERETAGLRKGLGILATVASITPFVGLLGTVIGIINAFGMLSEGGGIAKVGPGIAEALMSTAAGLIPAIIAGVLFNWFTGRVESMVVDMNDVSSEIIDYVLREGRA